ncbi:MAG: 16S rRNA (uracil(1498)-N(3))-methyltransferase [Myxococcales bacterium]|nr:16S rRNA (uracil(1498)-N(3))-methyltransferase [Myxococcales bacterium]
MTDRVRVAAESLRAHGAVVRVEGEGAHHLARVLRVKVGAEFELFDGEGWVALGAVQRVDGGGVTFALVEAPRQGPCADRAAVTWWQGFPKGDKWETVIRQATELGVARVGPVFTERAVVQPRAERAEARLVRWQRVAEEAARQCGRADVPEVLEACTLAQALAGLGAQAAGALRVVCAPGASRALTEVVSGAAGPLTVLVGPEGGLSEDELVCCEAAGFVRVSLGPRVWRTETAAPAVLGIVSALMGDLTFRAG